jgi:hypothetical protein
MGRFNCVCHSLGMMRWNSHAADSADGTGREQPGVELEHGQALRFSLWFGEVFP